MYIYVGLILIVCFLLLLSKCRYIKMKNTFIIITFIFIMLVGCRNISMGQFDTERVYMPYYFRILNNDISYVFTLKDIGFQLITFVFTRLIGDNFQLYIFLLTIPYISMVSFMIYKYSKYPTLSFIIFISLQYFEISFTLIRQINAMALLLVATHFLINEKNKSSLFCIMLAGVFHQTSLIYLVIFGLKNFNIKKKYIPFILCGSLIFLFLPSPIMNLLYKVLGDDSRFYIYADKGQQKTYIFYLLNLIIWIICYLGFKFENSSKDRKLFFWGATVALYLSPLTLILGEMSRIVYYFGIYEVLIFPDICSRFNYKDRIIFSFCVCIPMILYFLFILGPGSNVIPYIPFN